MQRYSSAVNLCTVNDALQPYIPVCVLSPFTGGESGEVRMMGVIGVKVECKRVCQNALRSLEGCMR